MLLKTVIINQLLISFFLLASSNLFHLTMTSIITMYRVQAIIMYDNKKQHNAM